MGQMQRVLDVFTTTNILAAHLASRHKHRTKFWTLAWFWLLLRRHAVIIESSRSSPRSVAMTMHSVLKGGSRLRCDDVINDTDSRPRSQVWCWCGDSKGWSLLHWDLNDSLFCEHAPVSGSVCIWNFPLDNPTIRQAGYEKADSFPVRICKISFAFVTQSNVLLACSNEQRAVKCFTFF